MASADKKDRGRPRQLFSRSIEEDRQVSKYKLDDAAEVQAEAYGYWSDLVPKFKKKMDDIELEISILTSEKYTFYRENLDGGNDSKGAPKLPTDTAISQAVAGDKDIVELKRDFNEAKEIYGLAVSAMNTMDQRRSMIKILDGQSERGYFDSSNREADQARIDKSVRDKTKANKAKMNESLKKKSEAVPEEEELDEESIEEEIEEEPVEEELTETSSDDSPEEDEQDESSEDDSDDSFEEDSDEDTATEEPEDEVEEDVEDEVEESGKNRCPFRHVFGKDFGNFNDCDECDEESPCFRESKKY